jgi:hypothetical protein
MNIFSNKIKILLCLVVLVIFSFAIRIYKVDTAPSGINADEASWGYNAYSILKTGKDEHDVLYPLIFKAFGDQKLPAYTYSLVPSIKVFGLNNFAIRFPAVIIGTLISVIIFFFLMQFGFSIGLSFIGAFIAATSPWQIILSRVFGYDSNLGLLFFTLGVLFSFLAYKKDKLLYPSYAGLSRLKSGSKQLRGSYTRANSFASGIYIVLACIAFGLTWYSYIAYRLITPIMLLSFIVIYLRSKKFLSYKGIILLIGFLIVVLPLIFSTFSGQGTARLNQIGSTPSLGIVLEINESRTFCGQALPRLLCYANFNKALSYSKIYLTRYINTLSPDYLFLSGDKDSEFVNVDNFGLFPFILLPFYLLGLIYLWTRIAGRKLAKNELFLIIGLLITPLPALLVDVPQKVRLSALLPFLLIVILYGISYVGDNLKKLINKKIYYSGLIAFLIISNIIFMINFLTVHIYKNEIVYGTYIPKLMKYLKQQDKKTQIYIQSIAEAIEFYAFINKVDPSIYQHLVNLEKPNEIGYAFAKDLENIHTTHNNISEVYCMSKRDNVHSLYITNEDFQEKFGGVNKIISTENGALKFMFVYDLNKIKSQNIDCKQVLHLPK